MEATKKCRTSANKVSIRRLRPSPSLIISLFALLVAMSTGAYAAVTIAPPNSVNSKSIKNENVKTEDLAAQAVSKGKLKKASVNGQKILDGSVGTKDIGDGQVGVNDIASAAKTALSHGGPAYSKHFETGVPLPTTMTTMALAEPAGRCLRAHLQSADRHLQRRRHHRLRSGGRTGPQGPELRPRRQLAMRLRSSPTTWSLPTSPAEPCRCSARPSAAAPSRRRG